MRAAAAVAFLVLAGPAWSQPADPLKSPACGERLQALQAARAQGQANVEAVRRAATQACLGGEGEARRPAPTAQAPIVVPPPVIEVPHAAAPTVAAPPPPPVITPPAVITHCDIAGCWDSSGTHLHRAGPAVVAPSGAACVATGTLVHCP